MKTPLHHHIENFLAASAPAKLVGAFFLCLFFALLTGCSGPSDEKIAKAQDTYSALANIHNQVVDAHQSISDNSLDSQLSSLAEKVNQIDDINLSEMADEDIDMLIETMNNMISSYEEYLKNIETIRTQEKAAVLVQIPLTLINQTDFTFTGIYLYEKGDISRKVNILEDLGDFNTGQTLTGLMIYRDVEQTPWILELDDSQASYVLELPAAEYDSSGQTLSLKYDPDLKEIIY